MNSYNKYNGRSIVEVLEMTIAEDVDFFIQKEIKNKLKYIVDFDWIIDAGVEGGSRGGQILFEGAPGDLRSCKESITAKYL